LGFEKLLSEADQEQRSKNGSSLIKKQQKVCSQLKEWFCFHRIRLGLNSCHQLMRALLYLLSLFCTTRDHNSWLLFSCLLKFSQVGNHNNRPEQVNRRQRQRDNDSAETFQNLQVRERKT